MTPLTLHDAEEDLKAAYLSGDPARIAAAEALVDKLDVPKPPASILASALWYAEVVGLKVFPLQAGSKIPHKGTRGCKDATTDSEQIRAWWERWPDSNVAIATGHVVDCVDIDGHLGQSSRVKHWDDIFAAIDADSVAKVLTPRLGGMHIYLPATGDGNSAGIVPGIDYRGVGGYVVAPPSTTEVGSYRFLGTAHFEAVQVAA